jgi:hypothetical protein
VEVREQNNTSERELSLRVWSSRVLCSAVLLYDYCVPTAQLQ